MRFAIFGAGGAGGYFGARLAEAGHDVVFIARGEHLRAIQGSGLKVASQHGDFVASSATATDDPATAGVVDCVIVGVKAWQAAEAARAIAPLVGPATIVVTLQNGVEAPDRVAEVLGREHVVACVVKIISMVIGPGHIKHVGPGAALELGELAGGPSARVEALCETFASCKGVTARVSADIRVALWAKFLLIAAWGGVGSLTRLPIGVIRGGREPRALLQSCMREIELVARANDVRLPPTIVDMTTTCVDNLPAGGTSSMQRDIIEGKPSELDDLNGVVIRLGAAVAVPTPTNDLIYAGLVMLERRARGEIAF